MEDLAAAIQDAVGERDMNRITVASSPDLQRRLVARDREQANLKREAGTTVLRSRRHLMAR